MGEVKNQSLKNTHFGVMVSKAVIETINKTLHSFEKFLDLLEKMNVTGYDFKNLITEVTTLIKTLTNIKLILEEVKSSNVDQDK